MNSLAAPQMLPNPISLGPRAMAPRVNATRQYCPATRFDFKTTAISWLVCLTIVGYFMVDSRNCRHSFIIPVLFCGVIIAHDMVDWLRGRFDVFDPVGLLGLFGFHWFFITPLLQVDWDWWLIEPQIRSAEPRTWIGWISVVNFIGLLIYRYSRNALSGRVNSTTRKVWILDSSRFWVFALSLLAISAVLQAFIYTGRGGIADYMVAIARRDEATLRDLGIVAMFAEFFPILAMMAYALAARRRPALASWPMLTLTLLIFLGLAMLFGGLRGSRVNTMFQLFSAVGMIHFLVRPISRKMVIVGTILLFCFAYMYGFYKSAGLKAFFALQSGESLEYLEHKTGRTAGGLLLAELSRTEIHSFVLYRLADRAFEFDLAKGRTYYATLCRFIPSFIWSRRPELINFEGTEILYGKGSHDPQRRNSSYVYGALPEAMMNFGIPAVPFLFLAWTFLIARVRKWVFTLDPRDVRLLVAPWFLLLCIMFFISDSDNDIFFLVKYSLLPFVVVWISSNRWPLRQSLQSRGTAYA